MKKILLYLLAILTPFIFISGASAAKVSNNLYYPDQILIDKTGKEPIYQVVSNLKWWGQSGSATKWAFRYDNLDIDTSKKYSVSGAFYFDTNVNAFTTPVISISNKFCSIEHTYNYNYQIMKDFEYYSGNQGESYDWSYYGTNISQIVSFSCDNVSLSNTESWVNVIFPESISTMRITELLIDESGSQTIITQQEETNDKLQESINKQNEIKQEQKKTNEELVELNDNITNSDSPDGMDSLGSASGWLPPGPVDSLLTLPLSMLNNISTSLGSTCKSINLPIPFVDKNLTMPCLNTIYSQISGLGIFLNSIGTIAAGFMLYYYFKKLYAYIDNLLSLKNNGEGWGDV